MVYFHLCSHSLFGQGELRESKRKNKKGWIVCVMLFWFRKKMKSWPRRNRMQWFDCWWFCFLLFCFLISQTMTSVASKTLILLVFLIKDFLRFIIFFICCVRIFSLGLLAFDGRSYIFMAYSNAALVYWIHVHMSLFPYPTSCGCWSKIKENEAF